MKNGQQHSKIRNTRYGEKKMHNNGKHQTVLEGGQVITRNHYRDKKMIDERQDTVMPNRTAAKTRLGGKPHKN